MTRALIFPGQGAQYVGMGGELAAAFPVARALLERAEAVLDLPLARLLTEGPEEELTRTDISQPAILVVSLMALAVLRERLGDELAVTATGGLSLGEYTALVAAGALAEEDAIRLVRLRGQAMQAAAEAVPGGMVALIGSDEEGAEALCAAVRADEVLQVANLNAVGQVVISGTRAACERAVAAAKEHGIRRAMPLPVAGAFHSALMAPAAERLRAALDAVTFCAPQVAVYHNVDAAAHPDPAAIPDLLVRQLTEPVRWADCTRAMAAAGITELWELGPGKTLCGMAARTVKDLRCGNLDQPGDLEALLAG